MDLMFMFLLFSLIMKTESGGKVWLKLLSFSNSRGKGANNHYCDGKYFFRGSDCDHRFILCLDVIHGPQNTDTCGYGRVATSPIHNRNSFTFGSSIGSTPNPMTFAFSKWTGSCKLKIDIYDHDDNADDYVDFMAAYFFKSIPDYNATTATVMSKNLHHRVSMSVQLKVYCDPNYYGPGCDKFCEPSEKYTCNRFTGTKICSQGWIGPDCDTKEDACSVSPCQNEGTCHNSLGSYMCVCQPGFDGTNCDIDIDECASLPCGNNGTCVDLINTYQCVCPYGYTGENCSIKEDLCINNPCLNNGTCLMDPNDVMVKCTCANGWTGNFCTTDVNECHQNVCLNNGTCENTVGGFNCFCTDYWHGDTCQNDMNECLANPCFGNSTCVNTNGSFDCFCPDGFSGPLCNIDVDECSSSPCLNGGLCVDKMDGFSCECPKGYSDDQCGTEIDECAGLKDNLNLLMKGRLTKLDTETLATDLKGAIHKYTESGVENVSIGWSKDWLFDKDGNVVSNVTLQVKLDGILICGDENIKELKELLFKERSGLTSRLFHGDLTEYRHPVASVERHQMEKQTWFERNWYLVVIAGGLLLLVSAAVLVLRYNRRRKSRTLDNTNITNNVRWDPEVGASSTLPSLSFDNDLYQCADSSNWATFSSQQTTEEEQPIQSPLTFDNSTYQKAFSNEQSDFLNSNVDFNSN